MGKPEQSWVMCIEILTDSDAQIQAGMWVPSDMSLNRLFELAQKEAEVTPVPMAAF